MAVLITGGAGFIGSTLADKLLQEEKRVVVLDNFDGYYNVNLKKDNVSGNLLKAFYKLYKGDICDLDTLEKVFSENDIEAVIHLAACAGVRNSFLYPQKYIKTNIEGTANILEKMKEHKVQKLVFASSSSVYGNCEADIFSEDIPDLKPISPYAMTKLAGEQLIDIYSKNYGIKAVCLRFFTVFGPRQRPDLAIRKFAEAIKNDQPITLYGDGTTSRDYTYVGDIVNGICSAISYEEASYEIINLGSGNPISLNEMVQTLESVIGKQTTIEHLPMQQGDVNKTYADISKASKLLNYKTQYTFKQALESYILSDLL